MLNLKDFNNGGLNQLQTIGEALLQFKKKGKKVIVSEDYYTQAQYFLASYADEVFLNPMGFIDIHGFGNYRLYYREALEKLRIKYAIFKVGEFKSALEPITRNNMSEKDRMQNNQWLNGLWSLYLDTVARQRGLSQEILSNYSEKIDVALQQTGGDIAQLALKLKLVDRIMTREQCRKFLEKFAGGKDNFIPSEDYLIANHSKYKKQKSKGGQVGILVAEGTILPGKQSAGTIGSESLSTAIRKAGKNRDIKALVLRVNSPGGSAFASEIIRQALLEFKKTKKPLVVSMGSYAASGGYWISADSDEIWASAATLTGSIGIFGALPDFSESLATLGIHSDGTGTTPLAAGLNITRTLPPNLKGAIQQNVEHSYEQFLSIVANGRKMPIQEIRKLAGGRVYDGVSARAIGLVDNLVSLDDAIQSAAKLAGLSHANPMYLREKETVEEQLLEYLSSDFNFNTTAPQFFNNSNSIYKYASFLLNSAEKVLLPSDPLGIYALSMVHFNL